ncbi:MAG: hypothetical protein JSS56_23020 [Proteobacteria bacterium]|nr:hypothetical protein [Pseudomonadota bacterium]
MARRAGERKRGEMSLEKTKKQLIELLGNADSKVIALAGRWGTGKTQLWNEVKKDPYVATELHGVVSELTGGQDLAEHVIQAWIAAFQARGGTAPDDDNPLATLYIQASKAPSTPLLRNGRHRRRWWRPAITSSNTAVGAPCKKWP